jgi:three-Cys-motif partner protein
MVQRRRAPTPDGQVNFGFDDGVANALVPMPARGARRKPRASERDLSVRPHTRLKLDSLMAYLPQWFGIASNRSTDTYYIDAFAGAGQYPDGSTTAKGSPVIACEAALDAVQAGQRRGGTWRPHLRFIERSRKTAMELRAELARFDGVLDYRVIQGDAAKELPDLILETIGRPTLLFVDPDGYKPVTFDLLHSLAGRRTMTEILLSVDAQGIRRAHARGETAALAAFSGGEWWSGSLGPDGLIDLRSYFRGLCSRLGGVGALFPYANVQHLEFLSNHAHRAIIQCCMSAEGPKRWMAGMAQSRVESQVIDSIFPELDRQEHMNAIIDRLRTLAGRDGFYFRDCINAMSDVAWSEADLHQALLFLKAQRLVDWSSRLGRAASPAPRFTFAPIWPDAVAWDGQMRSQAAVRQPAAAASGRGPAPDTGPRSDRRVPVRQPSGSGRPTA